MKERCWQLREYSANSFLVVVVKKNLMASPCLSSPSSCHPVVKKKDALSRQNRTFLSEKERGTSDDQKEDRTDAAPTASKNETS